MPLQGCLRTMDNFEYSGNFYQQILIFGVISKIVAFLWNYHRVPSYFFSFARHFPFFHYAFCKAVLELLENFERVYEQIIYF